MGRRKRRLASRALAFRRAGQGVSLVLAASTQIFRAGGEVCSVVRVSLLRGKATHMRLANCAQCSTVALMVGCAVALALVRRGHVGCWEPAVDREWLRNRDCSACTGSCVELTGVGLGGVVLEVWQTVCWWQVWD